MSENFDKGKIIKKLLHFIPTAIYTLLILGFAVFLSINSIESTAWVFFILFFISDFLLSRKSLFGGMIGIVIGLYFISYGKQSYTGIETPIGIFLVLLYMFRMYFIWKKNRDVEKE